MRLSFLYVSLVLGLGGCAPGVVSDDAPPPVEVAGSMAETPALMTWADLTGRPMPEPTSSVTFGEGGGEGVGDLWLPDGAGPHPVVLMVHGGCWQKAIADRTLMNYAAEDLRRRGMAVWNIEYRGVDEPGGGYAGTFLDVARAADELRSLADGYDLDLDRVAAFGHSAGGHLALWLAARPGLPAGSALRTGDPLRLVGVVNSGGLADLEASAPVTQADCLSSIMDRLTGAPDAARLNVFSDTSPAEMLPLGVRQVSVNGEQDHIAPPVLGLGYTQKARDKGDAAEAVVVPATGHVELIAPGSAAFEVEAGILLDMLGRR